MPPALMPSIRYIFILFISLVLLTGCSDKEPARYTIGFSQCTNADDWRKTMVEGMGRELSFYPEVSLVMKDANGRTETQISQIDQLIEQKVDLLIVSPNESAPITPAVERAYHRGIPVVILDRQTNSEQFTAYVGADNREVGALAGDYARNLLKGKGNILEISELPGSSVDLDRHRGFLQAISPIPQIQLVKKLNGNWEKRDLTKPLREYLSSHPDIDLIFCQNDRRALTAYAVCEALGLSEKVKIIGVDGLMKPLGGVDLVDQGKIDATILYPTGGEEAIATAMAILQKKAFERKQILPITAIDSSNVRMMKLQNTKVLAQQKDIERRQQKIEQQQIISKNQTLVIYGVSISLILALVFGIISFYSLKENRKINHMLGLQNAEIRSQKNRIEQLALQADQEHETKLKFFTNISHEFRTPLTLILAPIEDLLSQPLPGYPAIQRELSLVRVNTLRLLRLVNQVMDFRKLESSKMQVHGNSQDIVAFLRQIMNSFERLAQKQKIDFQLVTSEKEIMVWFDPGMFDKIIFNILSNAFKFVPKGGRIYIFVRRTEDEQFECRIEDNGPGMTASDLEHIFEVFYQGSGSYKTLGTGLGLALSKELVSLHGGSIEAHSTPSEETSFTILLPLRPEKVNQNGVPAFSQGEFPHMEEMDLPENDIEWAIDTPSVKGREQSILIIEDHKEVSGLLAQKLQPEYDIWIASTGEEGLKLAFDHIPDLIISDIMLPGKDGLSLAQTLKTDFRTSHIPIMLLTAQSGLEQQIAGIKTGVDSYIIKPFNLQLVAETVKTLLKNRILLREHYSSELPIEHSGTIVPKKLDKKFITQFTAYIEEHFAQSELSVEDIATALGMSRVQLYRKVKALLGMSVNEYLQESRLNKARFLLRREEYTIADVAYKVGFSSPTYFSTAFKNRFQQTPMEYKKS
ncbi:hybrid sensor histidine kinase/response regulator transcription factor [Dyadobacter tibetensis]|uniref:hybrid sensor histidine kinase/response regulator transcription factor n=1 Tax=Dyadobacter tibetensis TaxID=1211851 RepID=UPI0004B8E414|nr:substrate-binding domain-containing protein [Dyadobacter tibetensis]